MRLVLSIVFATAAASTAHADQCQLVDSKVATRAVELARKSSGVLDYCEPCGDKVPKGPYRIVTADIKNGVVQINGRSVDLAYTYLHTTGDDYANLAASAGCPTMGVSRSVKDARPVSSPPPPPPPMPPRPMGPPPKRITSTDDIGGTWSVQVRPAVSTCSVVPTASPVPPRSVTWTITSTNGDLSVMTDDGHEMSVAGATLARFNMLDVQVGDTKAGRRSMKLHQFSVDTFDGRLVVIEQKARQTCATAYDVYAHRVP